MATGAVAPLLRRRLDLPRFPALAVSAAAPAALCVALPRSRLRDVAVCGLQMWAYLAAYRMPNDDPEQLRRRVHVDYPIQIDRVLGGGRIPTQRLQQLFARDGEINGFERILIWSHWTWFAVPHLAVAYVALRRPSKLAAAAGRMYTVFDLGAMVYWVLPTAPPWWAAAQGHIEELPGQPPDHIKLHPRYDDRAGHLPVRRMMLEYGERFWGNHWNDLYDVLGGNPLAAMPSLHFATTLMAARLLSEVDPVAGAVGWIYTATLGLALVYLGEHYAADVIAGGVLAEAVHRGARPMSPAARQVARALDSIRRLAEDR